MLFIHPMWDSETERIGKQLCTPAVYLLHVIAEFFGFGGLLLILTAVFRLVLNWDLREFGWIMAWSIGLGILSDLLMAVSWSLARRKGFRYDPVLGESTWTETSQVRRYKWDAHR